MRSSIPRPVGTMHATRGITHIWTAAVVAGLAVVITGALAFSSTQAAETKTPAANVANVLSEIQKLNLKLDKLDARLTEYFGKDKPKPLFVEDKNNNGSPDCFEKCKAVSTDDAALGKCVATMCEVHVPLKPESFAPVPSSTREELGTCKKACLTKESACKEEANGAIEMRQKCERTRETCVKGCLK